MNFSYLYFPIGMPSALGNPLRYITGNVIIMPTSITLVSKSQRNAPYKNCVIVIVSEVHLQL